MDDPIVGTEFNGYRVQEVLGQGGMGVVYRAEDVALSRTVALKCVNRSLAHDESFLRRFRSEAQALAQIDSPYIVQVYTLAELEIGLVIVMEYVDGTDLRTEIAGGGTDWTKVIPLLRQTLSALEDAHAANVVHRDVKPHNILLSDTATAHGNTVKMTDFGLAKIHRSGDRSRTVTEGVYGSLNYMSPEQVEGLGGVDPRSDLYSLGMTGYELLAGRLPFPEDGTTYRVMRTIVEGELPPLSRFVDDVPPPLIDVIMRALEKDPAERFQSAAEMRNAVDELATRFLDPTDRDTTPLQPDNGNQPSGVNPRVPSTTQSTQSSGSLPPNDAESPSRTPSGAARSLAGWNTVGVVLLLAALLSGTGYVAYSDHLHPLLRPGEGSSSRVRSALPPPIAPLVSIERPAKLEAEIDKRVEQGTLIKGTKPEDFFIDPRQCFVFVIDRSSDTVEALIDTGTVRVNLRAGTPVPNWSSKYDDHRQIWVALSR